MKTARLTIKKLPPVVCEPHHPMSGIPQRTRYVYRVRVDGSVRRSGVTSDVSLGDMMLAASL